MLVKCCSNGIYKGVHLTLVLRLFVCLFVSLLSHFWLIHLFYLHLLYQPYVGLCQATRVQSHQRQSTSATLVLRLWELATLCSCYITLDWKKQVTWCNTIECIHDIAKKTNSTHRHRNKMVAIFLNKMYFFINISLKFVLGPRNDK